MTVKYTYTTNIGAEDKEHIRVPVLYKESLLNSIISDICTFGIVTLCFSINHIYVGSTFLAGVLLFMFTFYVLAKGFSKGKEFHSAEDVYEHLKKHGCSEPED